MAMPVASKCLSESGCWILVQKTTFIIISPNKISRFLSPDRTIFSEIVQKRKKKFRFTSQRSENLNLQAHDLVVLTSVIYRAHD